METHENGLGTPSLEEEMLNYKYRLRKARNLAFYFWLAVPLVSIAGLIIIGEGISPAGAFWSLGVAILYLGFNGVFFWRVWTTPGAARSKRRGRRILVILTLVISLFFTVQIIPQDVKLEVSIGDAFIPLWVTGTVRGWGFPSFWMRELADLFVIPGEYGKIVIDYSSMVSNLLFAMFALFVFHWLLSNKWHRNHDAMNRGEHQNEEIDP